MVGWFNPGTTINPTNDPNMPAPDPAGVQQFNNQGAYLSNLATLLGGGVPQGDQNPLGSLFQTMFGGGGRRPRRGNAGGRGTGGIQQQWLQPGGGVRPPYTPQYGAGPDGLNGYDYGGQAPQYAGQYGYIWRGDQPIAYDPNLGVPQGYSVFHRGQDALQGLPGVTGGAGGAGGQVYGGGRGGGRQPAITGGTRYRGGPAGAPWFANADGTVFANGMNAPDIGGQPGVDPNSPYYIAPGLPGGAATIPWQGSWADPASSNFYLRQFGLQTPSDYLNPGQWRWGQGPAMNSGYGGGGWQGGMTGGPQGGAQGGTPPSYPPGGNGPTGPAQPPPAQAGNFQMYPGMPYAGGMGPYSGWLPPAPGTQTDYGGPGQASSPLDAYQRQQAAATQPGGPNSGYLPPAPGTQQDWGGAGQSASPLDAAIAQYGGSPGGDPQATTGLAGNQYYNNLGMPNDAWSNRMGGGPWG